MGNALLSNSSNLAEVVKAETVLIDQLPTILPNATILVDGVKMTIAQILAQARAHLTTIETMESLRAQLSDLVITQKAQRSGMRITAEALKIYVAATFGIASSQYSALGFKPTARAKPSVEARAAAVAKMLATRALHHIMGKKQRAAIHAAPAPAPAPAPVAAPEVKEPTGR